MLAVAIKGLVTNNGEAGVLQNRRGGPVNFYPYENGAAGGGGGGEF